MRILGGALVALIGIALVGSAGARAGGRDAVDAKKLVGTWEAVKGELSEKAPGSTLRFDKAGKLTLTFQVKGKGLAIPGTYKLNGNKLSVVQSFGGKENRETMTIESLTDTTLITVDDKGKKDEFKRGRPTQP